MRLITYGGKGTSFSEKHSPEIELLRLLTHMRSKIYKAQRREEYNNYKLPKSWGFTPNEIIELGIKL